MKKKNKYLLAGIITILAIVFIFNLTYNYREKQISSLEGTREAYFAGGCFWCVESDFEKQQGVLEVISGYTGGDEVNPTYEQVSEGITGHYESVKVIYDPTIVSYSVLLDVLWKHTDPTDSEGQFVDRGKQYRSSIFYSNEEEKQIAEKSKSNLNASEVFDNPIVTEILPFKVFYPAEDYHQDYYLKNPVRYNYYRHGSGRDQFLESVWGQ
ncbi:peptide-methionine (S)-S-oxide reductase [Candidatus Pacearchaeota archaeon CG10_big_fil_rev_8_21_14_0_10_31_24]|nr:MAG: peptide-methionine (S)-S-oxide reductase [Candidatus Pacearchaeota archaeon CG10_big_fil_rev_8_21_14_0_10_31_24]